MTATIYHPEQPTDDIRIMPTTADLAKPHSEKQLIEEALSEFTRPKNLIASSRQELPRITVNGVAIDPAAIAQEMQYHPADSQDQALYLAAQALTIKELLHQAVRECDTLGEQAWLDDEEQAIGSLIEQKVQPQTPDEAACRQYFDNNSAQFVTPPVMTVRHILLASPPEAGEERLELKKQARELIEKLQNSSNRDADFIQFAQQFSACPSKDDGGNLGQLHARQTVPEFEKAVFALPAGVSVNPIETRYGVHIVEVLEKTDGVALTFEDALPAITNQLTQQSFHHALCDYLFTLSQNAQIEGIVLEMSEENVYRG